jgi:hypothetical protein
MLSDNDLLQLANEFDIDLKILKAIIKVESGGFGFAEDGKIIIQFEPSWFKRKAAKEYADYLKLKTYKSKVPIMNYWDTVLNNQVSNQRDEWFAFNAAFKINPDAAMQSTSIGMMQIMGFHYAELGFKTVGEMWDYAKLSEKNQVELALRFIKMNPSLYQAVKAHDFKQIAFSYNGKNYPKFNYDRRLETAFNLS